MLSKRYLSEDELISNRKTELLDAVVQFLVKGVIEEVFILHGKEVSHILFPLL